MTEGVVTVIHARGAERLDAVVDLVTGVARPRALAALLDEIPRRVAAVFASEVCSLYLREGDGLVMRGNVGFAHDALGEVRLAVGEGLVGMAVECMRPVSADVACDHARFRAFPGLGEERYPRFLTVPVPGASGPSGALVVQRSGVAYDARDVELLVALAGAVAPVLERARIVSGGVAPRSSPSSPGARRVTLTGRTLHPGRALGVVAAVRRPHDRGNGVDAKRTPREHARALERALLSCEATLDMHARAASRQGVDVGFLAMHRMMLEDGRFRERALELAKGRGLGHALAQVAREATRAARLTHADALDDRATELSELCDALRVLSAPEGAATPRDAIWIGDTVTVFELLLAARARPAALVLTQKAATPRVHAIVELMSVPTVAEVAGLYAWASDGDVALVDGDHGIVRVNPTRRERDAARVERASPTSPAPETASPRDE